MSSSIETPPKPDETRSRDEKLNLIEFIKCIDKMQLETIEMERREAEEEAAAQIEHQKSNSNLAKDGRKFSCGLRFLKKAGDSVSGDSSDVTPERKYSVEQQHRAKPSLKMKAFKNRQDTFHSLTSCCDPPAGGATSANVFNTSSASLTEDLIRMPFVEGSNPQINQVKQKASSKVYSDPISVKTPESEKDDSKKRRRVLHTEVQPDGSVIGFCTEEIDEGVQNEQQSSSKNPSDSSVARGMSKK